MARGIGHAQAKVSLPACLEEGGTFRGMVAGRSYPDGRTDGAHATTRAALDHVPVVRDDGRFFRNAQEASMTCEASAAEIAEAASTGAEVSGRRWSFPGTADAITGKGETAAGPDGGRTEERRAARRGRRRGPKPRRVERDDGTVYPSAAEAARAMGRDKSAICAAIRKGSRCGHHRWRYVGDPWKEPYIGKEWVQVRCAETGETWPTTADCARDIGACASTVAKYMATGAPLGGRHYERLDADEEAA